MPRKRRRLLKAGQPIEADVTPADVVRFMEKVRLDPTREYEGTPCWRWTAHTDENGYGQFKIGGKARWVHRFAWELFRTQALPDGDDVDHLCRNPACINPRHLEPKSRSANSRRNGRTTTSSPAKDPIPF